MYDVAVIGGGPTGSWVAYRLATLGYAVAVVEHKEKPGEQICCTGIISQECADSFAIDESVVFRRVNSARVFSPSGRRLSLYRPKPQACILNRAAFNMALVSRAQTQGVEFVLSQPVRDVEVRDDRVRIVTSHHGGKPSLLEARAVVIATGFGSNLAESLGLGKFSDFVMGAQAEVETSQIDEVEIYLGQQIAPGFFAWLVPTSPHKALVGLLSRHSPRLYLTKLMASLMHQGKIASADADLSYGGIPLKPLPRTYANRVLVVGTAAGQVKPTTGGGIYYGLLCADMAADNLHRALQSDTLAAKNLAGYEREWKRKLGWELNIGYWGRKLYELMNDAQIDRILDIMLANDVAEDLLKADDLSFDWHGMAVLRLVGHKTLSRALKKLKLPFPLKGKHGEPLNTLYGGHPEDE